MAEVELTAVVRGMEGGAMLLVRLEDVLQLASGGLVEDEAVDLVVEEERTCIEVRATYRAEATINHHDLGVMETRLVVIDLSSALRHLLHLEAYDIGGDGDVALGRHHDFEANTALEGTAHGTTDALHVDGVWVDDLNVLASSVDSRDISTPHVLGGLTRTAINDSNDLLPSRRCEVGEDGNGNGRTARSDA